MRAMGARYATPLNKSITELIAIIAVGVAVLGQAAWLDGKIERVQEGQADIRERLAAMEIRLAAMETRLGIPPDLAQTETKT